MSSVEKPKRQKAKDPVVKKTKEPKETTVKKPKEQKEPITKETTVKKPKEQNKTKEKQPKINDFNDLIKQQTQVLAKLQEYMERLEANEQKMENMLNEKK